MENASKALIIAGAILISILLISIGIMVIQSAQGVTEQTKSTLKGQELQIFNSQFTNYAGKQKGAVCRKLIEEIIASNAAHEVEKVKVNGNENINDELKKITSTTKDYTVDVEMDETTGLVINVKIQ